MTNKRSILVLALGSLSLTACQPKSTGSAADAETRVTAMMLEANKQLQELSGGVAELRRELGQMKSEQPNPESAIEALGTKFDTFANEMKTRKAAAPSLPSGSMLEAGLLAEVARIETEISPQMIQLFILGGGKAQLGLKLASGEKTILLTKDSTGDWRASDAGESEPARRSPSTGRQAPSPREPAEDGVLKQIQ